MIKHEDNKCLSQYETISEEAVYFCACSGIFKIFSETDDILFYMIESKIMYLCKNKIMNLKKLQIDDDLTAKIKLFDIDIPNKCIYFYDGKNLQKSCWKKKSDIGFKTTHVIASFKNVLIMHFNLLGRNLFFSTDKALFLINVDTKYTKTLFKLKNIHYFLLLKEMKFFNL